ncbi:MAG: nitroreductase family protein [Clostridiales bacterium]|nr:nitroreductase family protein [Clostridiales bacterium]
MKLETLQSMKDRRSIKSYLPDQIKKEELDTVLEAGIYAANGRGLQSAKIVVVQDKETRDLLSRLNAQVMGTDIDPFYGAPTVLIVFADSESHTYLEDGSLVMGNLMLGAYAVGLGSCWIHRAKEVFEMPEGKELMEKWGLDAKYKGVGHCILGYIKGDMPKAKPRKADYILRV